MSQYEHTQRSSLHWLLVILAASFAIAARICRDELSLRILLLGVSGLCLLLSACFAQLTVRNDDEWLSVRFGPIPVFGTRILCSRIEAAKVGRSSWIDGWGIHWIPGRGTTFNLWGFDCVELCVAGRVVRIGTDDAKNLLAFIQSTMRARARDDTAGPECGEKRQ
ncbi:MAG: hypothetical protein HQ518_30915 [Rhodopirellula sp.]|nr:hypothetical protein [Rhodopirellula sp.]